jgi:hypothetical protein
MSYKRIGSCIHNYGHSFLSLMNWEDGEYIDDILARRVDEDPEQTVIIDFVTGTILPSDFGLRSNKLQTSVTLYRERWPGHVASHGIVAEKIIRCELHFAKRDQTYRAEVFAIDSKGREYTEQIKYG